MSARTCLLCGKALSRIWVGAGEDFCSREHRNQYRLRRGMDRLQEANKVASLMRRRENPKPLPSVQCLGNASPRHPETAHIRLGADTSARHLPESKWTPPVRVPGGRSWVEQQRRPLPATKPRSFGILRQRNLRVTFGRRTHQAESPAARYLERMREPRPFHPKGRQGDALRVSAGSGFRVPAMKARPVNHPAHVPVMQWPDRPRLETPGSFNMPATSALFSLRFAQRELLSPPAPAPPRRTGIEPQGALAFGKRLIPCDTLPEVRAFGELWSRWEESPPRPIHHTDKGMPAQRLVITPIEAISGRTTPQLALVPLMPLDAGFSYSPSIVYQPSRSAGALRASLEENFSAGLSNWVGGVQDWVTDVAGVRTGSLALYAPSLEKRDYELEFLTRIEHHSVSWVFRASNVSEYHFATIAAAESGGYEFRRGSQIEGVRKIDSTCPVPMAQNTKTAVTVRLRAAGNEFTVTVEGVPIDAWTDNRLPVGGVGFVGAVDDRARIYWVRLSPTGGTGKEYPRR